MNTIELRLDDTTLQQSWELLERFNAESPDALTLQEYLELVLRWEIEKRYKGDPNNWQQSRLF